MRTKLTALAIAALAGMGCLSMQSQTTLDAIHSAMSIQPYVEGYVEYAGPNSKWSGPASFILHVSAKEAGYARISATPPIFGEMAPPPTMGGRVPASQGYPMELAREHLAHLATAIQGADPGFRGCLSPVRIRLVRADGSLLEKQGCRGQSGWARVASETVSHFVTAMVHGLPAPAPAQPAQAVPAQAQTQPGVAAPVPPVPPAPAAPVEKREPASAKGP
jgi:hypothetical protein